MTSIRIKLPFTAALLFAGGLCVLIGANAIFLEPFYAAETKNDFRQIQEKVSSYEAEDPHLADEIKLLGAESGYKIVIADRAGMVLASSVPEYRDRQTFPLPRKQLEFLKARRDRLDRGESFFGILESDAGGQPVMQLLASIGDGRYLVITQALEFLRRNASTASRFFLLVGGLVLLGEFVIVLVLSGSISRPILHLTEVARRVAAHDFSARSKHKRNDELGLLGDSINRMAESLAGSIDKLTTANSELALKIRTREDFLAGASHELKTPVGLVRGYAEAIMLGLFSSEQERNELADIILKEADHLDRLVRDLSEIAALDSVCSFSGTTPIVARGPLMLEEADLSEAVSDAVARFHIKARDKGVSLSFEGSASLQAVFDQDRIVQVVDNLLSNALRHTPADGTIQVRLSATLRLEVENSGEQIPEELLANLFEPFYRIDASRTRGSGGSGLGLTVVRSIVQAHGGTCGAANVPSGFLVWVQLLPETKST